MHGSETSPATLFGSTVYAKAFPTVRFLPIKRNLSVTPVRPSAPFAVSVIYAFLSDVGKRRSILISKTPFLSVFSVVLENRLLNDR